MSIVIGNLGRDLTGWQYALDKRPRKPPEETAPNDRQGSPRDSATLDPYRSEQQRAVVGGLDRAIQASEQAISIVTSAQSGLVRISKFLTDLSQAVRMSLDGPGKDNGKFRQEVPRLLREIDRTVDDTRFGDIGLLDGSLMYSGEARGAGLTFVSASPNVVSSPPEGYPVAIRSPASRASLAGDQPLTRELLRRPLELTVTLSGRPVAYRYKPGVSFEDLVHGFGQHLRRQGLDLIVDGISEQRLRLTHSRWGRGHRFTAESSVPGVLSHKDGSARMAEDGRDIAGKINGEPAEGRGEYLTGVAGNRTTDGLVVAYTAVPETAVPETAVPETAVPETAVPETAVPMEASPALRGHPHRMAAGVEVGRVILVQRALTFRFGAAEHSVVSLQLGSARSDTLGSGLANVSGFAALGDIRVGTEQQRRDALAIVGHAMEEVGRKKETLETLLRQKLMPTLRKLSVRSENLVAEQMAIRDVDFAHEVTNYLRGRMAAAGELAARAQSQPMPGAVLKLIGGGPEGRE